MEIDPALISQIELVLQVFLAALGAFLSAFWIGLVVWTFRDIRSRSRDIFTQLLATLLVLIFNLPGLFLYFILRPRETLDEAFDRALEEEALLKDLEGQQVCPSCKQRAEEDYLFCPNCHAQLKKACPDCGRLLHLQWDICPYCGSRSFAPSPEEGFESIEEAAETEAVGVPLE